MRPIRTCVCVVSVAVALSGCGFGRPAGMDDLLKQSAARQRAMLEGQDSMMAKQRLFSDMMSNPDLPQWHDQREKMALALGDRQFDKPFDRVFDAMTVALATLGCRVQNMERVSGYITASIPELPPTKMEGLEKDGARQYAVAKGYPANILEKSGDPFDSMFDSSRFQSMMSGLTLSMVKQGPETTKVKLRFDNVYYPALVDEYYRVVWQAVDKQIFLDKGLD